MHDGQDDLELGVVERLAGLGVHELGQPAMYLVRCDFQASSRIRLPDQPSPAHHTAASRA